MIYKFKDWRIDSEAELEIDGSNHVNLTVKTSNGEEGYITFNQNEFFELIGACLSIQSKLKQRKGGQNV